MNREGCGGKQSEHLLRHYFGSRMEGLRKPPTSLFTLVKGCIRSSPCKIMLLKLCQRYDPIETIKIVDTELYLFNVSLV